MRQFGRPGRRLALIPKKTQSALLLGGLLLGFIGCNVPTKKAIEAEIIAAGNTANGAQFTITFPLTSD